MRILITGASGLLGSNLVLAAVDAGHQVIATSQSRMVSAPNVQWTAADLRVDSDIDAFMADARPDWVIHCAAATDVDACELDPKWAMSLNRDVAAKVARAARGVGASLAHISTDAVFDGGPGPHAEGDEARPINTYGESKLAGELAVLAAYPGAAVVRTNFYGWSPPGRLSLAQWFLANLRAGEGCNGFTDILVSPLLTNDLAGACFRVLQSGGSGTYHLGCAGRLSKYQLGIQLAHAFDLDPDLIAPTTSDKAGLAARRPRDLSLSSTRVEKELDIYLPDCSAGIERMVELEEGGYKDRLTDLIVEPTPSERIGS